MTNNRRDFLKQAASFTALSLLSGELYAKGTLKEFGCQLYNIMKIYHI